MPFVQHVNNQVQSSYLDAVLQGSIEDNHAISSNLKFRARFYRAPSMDQHQVKKLSPSPARGNLYLDSGFTALGKPERQKREKKGLSDLIKEENVYSESQEYLCKVTREEFLTMTTETREGALSAQLHVATCNQDCVEKMANHAQFYISKLIGHYNGNYTLQKLIVRSSRFAHTVASYCRKSFKDLASNEYASRVMQSLIESDETFCSFAMSAFRNDLPSFLHSSPSVFLVSIALKNTNESERDIFRFKVPRNMRKMLMNKYFKRVLISYITTCSFNSLSWVFNRIRRSYPTITDYFRDRYSTLLLVAFLERGCSPMERELLLQISYDPLTMLDEELCDCFLAQVANRTDISLFQRKLNQTLRNFTQYHVDHQLDPRIYSKLSQAIQIISNRRSRQNLP